LRGADFRASSLKGARFSHADARNADFNPLYFEVGGQKKASVTDLSGCNMRYTNCAGARMVAVNFKGADIAYGDFTGCDMREADFTGANIESARFTNANIEGAKFDGEPPKT